MADQFIEKVFGHDGLIARFHEAYEYRTGQIEMAERVAEAFANRRHLIVEAGTGTGKTLAYLVPAIAAAIASGSVKPRISCPSSPTTPEE